MIGARLRDEHAVNADRDVRVVPFSEYGVQAETRSGLWLIFGAVTLLLALACTNAAGLSAARGNRRGREMGIRTAIGTGRGTLVRQLLSESLVLAMVATGAGVAMGAPRAATLILLMKKCGGPVIFGLGIGLPAAAGGAGLLQSLLFDVRPLNLGTYLGTALVLLIAAAAASYFPALAATAIDPIDAIRADQ